MLPENRWQSHAIFGETTGKTASDQREDALSMTNPKRRSSALLLIVALALLVTALAGPVRRAWDERARAEAARTLAEKVDKERADATARFGAERPRILAEVRERLDQRDFAGAMTAASPYVHLGDEALRELFKEAASSESRRKRRDLYRTLIGRECTQANVSAQARTIVAAASESAAAAAPPLTLVRLTGAEARETVRARLHEPPPAEPAAKGPDPAAREPGGRLAQLRQENRARVLPDYLGFLYAAGADDLICVWRVEGNRSDGSRQLRYTMNLWLAPTPDGNQLTADLVTFNERPI